MDDIARDMVAIDPAASYGNRSKTARALLDQYEGTAADLIADLLHCAKEDGLLGDGRQFASPQALCSTAIEHFYAEQPDGTQCVV